MLRRCLLASLIGLACAQSNTQSNNWYSASAGSSTISTASITASMISSIPSSSPTTISSTSAVATSSSASPSTRSSTSAIATSSSAPPSTISSTSALATSSSSPPSTRSSTAVISTSSSPSSSAVSSSVASPSITSSSAASSSTVGPMKAVAMIDGPGKVKGTVTFQQADANSPTFITYSLTNNDPSTLRGVHIHALPGLGNSCLDSGPHFNPNPMNHGGLTDLVRHAGDLGNIATDSQGTAAGTLSSDRVMLFGPASMSVLGRTFVIHGGTDDNGKGTGDAMMLSQTTGNSGARISCGIIMLTT